MLVITPATTAAIRSLRVRAYQSPFTYAHIRKNFRSPLPERTLVVPHGHKISFTVAQFRPGWRCRQLAIQGPDKWPTMADVRYVMGAFDFKSPIEACLTWTDGPDHRRQVNILEPLDGDWSPMRSS